MTCATRIAIQFPCPPRAPPAARDPFSHAHGRVLASRMSRPPARSATAPSPHTRKRPDRCPHCGSRDLSRKGTRSKKFETVQLWRCRGCRRVFTPAPAALRNKTYPLRVILDALTWYDLGYTLDDTRAKLKARYGLSVAASSITGWFAEHKELTSYRRLRPSGM